MLVIKQNGRNKLGRTGGDIHTETDKNGHRAAVWPATIQAGGEQCRQPISSSVPSDPLSPGSPSQKSLCRGGCRAPGKGTQKENSWKDVWRQRDRLLPRTSLPAGGQAYVEGGLSS